MPERSRRGLPDNLDPLVDTLSNVVGILVVVVALTQLQVGDALERLIELDASRLSSAKQTASDVEVEHAELSERLAKAEQRRQAIMSRSSGDIQDAILAANQALKRLEELPTTTVVSDPSTLSSEAGIEALRQELESKKKLLERRSQYAEEIQQVPPELVARLPDPGIVTGEEAWIFCRYGRCYLTDRTALIDAGAKSIGEIFGEPHQIRSDEFESVAHHLRKRDIGYGNFRWRMITDPQPRVRVEWRSQDPGIERARISTSPEFARWLAERSTERDFIRFQVWNDSFEAYLEARQVTESAGFRAGWDAFDALDELDLTFVFGKPPPREGPVEVD